MHGTGTYGFFAQKHPTQVLLRNYIFKGNNISDFRPDLNIYMCVLLLIRFRINKTLPVLRNVMPCFDMPL